MPLDSNKKLYIIYILKVLREESDENHPLKQLKNDASERFVPIHNQLLDLGFVDYVNRKKAKMKATGSDFIFPKCQTSGGIYNSKYLVRTFSKFLTDIKILCICLVSND